VEEPLRLAAALEATPGCVLVDCLTLWLMNLLEAGEDVLARERKLLLRALETRHAPTLLVANEVGFGVIPLGELTRRYVDEAGWLNQAVARLADRVILVAAGLPLTLKETQP
jgi:adenosylcobinamide kinase/adenosylcobinamide-phosphate guanylyltransferase